MTVNFVLSALGAGVLVLGFTGVMVLVQRWRYRK